MIRRIYILGNSSSGKSSLSRKLSSVLRIKSYDLDDIFWEKKFTAKRDKKKALAMFKTLVKKKNWIIEGVYSSYAKIGVEKADFVIWLDYPFHIVAWRLLKRQLAKRVSLTELADFLHYIWDYRRKPGHKHYQRNEANYYKHKELIEKHCAAKGSCDYVKIRSNKEMERLLKGFSER